MAMAKKPRKDTEDKSPSISNSSGSDDLSYDTDNESSSSVESGLEIPVDFQGHSITLSDYYGIKQLIQSLLPNSQINMSELTELVVSQKEVGSVVKFCAAQGMDSEGSDIEEVDDVLALATVINLTLHKEKESVKQLKSFILEKAKMGTDCFSKLSAVFSSTSQPVGLLICERFLNIPVHLAVPLLQAVNTEVTEACKKGNAFKFKYYLVLARTHIQASSMKRKRKGKGKGIKDKSTLGFDFTETEYMYKESVLNFTYPVEEDSGVSNDAYRTVILLPVEKLDLILTTIQHELI
ncbi:protein BCCIP homolog [Dysidea avara]|uniref:protein BCCIP homolog n=1 Tax=Dysidea avara TaxID=196820 RepID=UPI0033328790